MRKHVEDFVDAEWDRVEAGHKVFDTIIDKGTKHGVEQHEQLSNAADDSERTTLKAHEFKRNAAFVAGAAMLRHSVHATDKLQKELESVMSKDQAETETDLLFAGILKAFAEHADELLEI